MDPLAELFLMSALERDHSFFFMPFLRGKDRTSNTTSDLNTSEKKKKGKKKLLNISRRKIILLIFLIPLSPIL